MPHYADSFKKRMDLPPDFHPHMSDATSNMFTASSTNVSMAGGSPRRTRRVFPAFDGTQV